MNTFLQEQGFYILTAIIILIAGALLRPTFEKIGQKLLAWLQGLGTGFEKGYYNYLLDEYRVMPASGRKATRSVNMELEQVYVSLRVYRPDFIANGGGPAHLETIEPGAAMQRWPRLVIIGRPGSGKTTLLHYLLLTYARRQAKKRLGLAEKRLPIFVPLHQLKKVLHQVEQSLPHYLTTFYNRQGLTVPPGFFEKRLKAGRCLVLLDGLDEVADQNERVKMAEWVDRQVSIYAHNRFIVTSRPAGYNEAALGNNFTRLEVRDFNQADIEQFCHKWCLAAELDAQQGQDNPGVRRRANQAAADLIRAIGESQAVRKLADNPLQLSIIALVHRSGATLPKRRVELYARCVDVFLDEWDRAKGAEGLAGRLNEGQKRAVLQPIALFMHQQEKRELEAATLKQELVRHLADVNLAENEVDQFLREIKERSGLLQEKGLNLYAFSHLTFQEYLVARHLAEQGPEQLLLEQVDNNWWQEVTLLYTGLKDATSIVQSLLNFETGQAETRQHAPLLLAGRCLIDAQTITRHVREKTMSQLDNLFNTGAGRPFLEAGQVLAELEGEQAVTRFLSVVGGDNPNRRNAALWALEQMLGDENETRRREHWEQFMGAIEDKSLFKAALQVGQELSQQRNPHWKTEITNWLQSKVTDRTWLYSVVADRQIAAGQFLVSLLHDETAWPLAAACLDYLLAEIPGLSLTIARYPVTNAQYRRFIEAGGYEQQKWWGKEGWQWRRGKPRYSWQKMDQPDYWDDKKWNQPDYPVVGVTWYEAEAYCAWLSDHAGRTFRLPAEKEWQQAAQGGDGREYPWGNEWQADLCNTKEAGLKCTSPVGQYSPAGDSPTGCADMSGNVWEWCADKEGNSRVLRGGSWDLRQGDARCVTRGRNDPLDSDDNGGFRVVSPI